MFLDHSEQTEAGSNHQQSVWKSTATQATHTMHHNPNSYLLSTIYRWARFNGYGRDCAYRRFLFLRGLSFGSVLDVGSGPCLLRGWLQENGITADYEAVDIRADALALCDCPTYHSIPQQKAYDLVCLFGTVTYNIDHDEARNKEVLRDLLRQSIRVCRKWLVFTVFRESIRKKYENSVPRDFFVHFSREEIGEMLEGLGIYRFGIVEDDRLDNQEYFVACQP